MSSSITSSSSLEEPSSKNYFTFEAHSEESSEQSEQKEKIEPSKQEFISISNSPTCSFIYDLYLQCSYVITNLNLKIQQITKENSSLKDKLASKIGMEKLHSSNFFKKSPNINPEASYLLSKENHECFFEKKYCLSAKLSIQEKMVYSKATLKLTMTNFYENGNAEQHQEPLVATIITSIFSKSNPTKQEEKQYPTSLSNSSTEKIEQPILKHPIAINAQFQPIEEHQETKHCKKEESSQDKHHEKDQNQDQENSEKREEKIKLINKIAKHKKTLSKPQEQCSLLNFQEIDSFIKEKISSLSNLEIYNKNFLQYALQTSIISQIFNMRISNLDVLILFIEVMKLALKSRQQQHLFRAEERLIQLSHMKEIVNSYKDQANSLLFSGLASGLLAVFSGVAPIFGHIKGEWTLGHLSKVFSSLKDMESEKFFENVSKITLATSEMAKATGQIQTAFNESHRTYDDHYKESYKIDADDRSRVIEEIKDNWRSLENFLYQCLQMQHDTIKQLYQ